MHLAQPIPLNPPDAASIPAPTLQANAPPLPTSYTTYSYTPSLIPRQESLNTPNMPQGHQITASKAEIERLRMSLADQQDLMLRIQEEVRRQEQDRTKREMKDQMDSMKAAMDALKTRQHLTQPPQGSPNVFSSPPLSSWAQSAEADPSMESLLFELLSRHSELNEDFVVNSDPLPVTAGLSPLMCSGSFDQPGCAIQDPVYESQLSRVHSAETSIVSCFILLAILLWIGRNFQFEVPIIKDEFAKKKKDSSSSSSRSDSSATSSSSKSGAPGSTTSSSSPGPPPSS